MKTTCERFESGWIGVGLALRVDEVDALIGCLQKLKEKSIGHFQLTQRKWAGEWGIADIEFSLRAEDEVDDMSIG